MNFFKMEQLDLFRGMNSAEIGQICDCFGAQICDYATGETVFGEGETIKRFGVVLGGRANTFKTDISGKVFIVSVVDEGGYIGVFLAGMADKRSPVTVMAADRLTVLFMPFDKLVRQCEKNCHTHVKVLRNYIGGISAKAMHLYDRIDCLLKPTIREKVMVYLNQQSGQSGKTFKIPFDREGLAEYLNAERSSLSRELANMKKNGIIDYHKSTFKIL